MNLLHSRSSHLESESACPIPVLVLIPAPIPGSIPHWILSIGPENLFLPAVQFSCANGVNKHPVL